MSSFPGCHIKLPRNLGDQVEEQNQSGTSKTQEIVGIPLIAIAERLIFRTWFILIHCIANANPILSYIKYFSIIQE